MSFLASLAGIVLLSSAIMFVLSFLIFRRMWFDSDGVRAIVFNPSTPTVIDIVYIGRDYFDAIPKSGAQRPYSTSSGSVLYVVEKWTEKEITFSWIHEASTIEFVSKKKSFDFLSDLSSRYMMAYNRIRDIPYSLGLYYGGHSIQAYEDDKLRQTITLNPTDSKLSDLLQELRVSKDPIDALRAEYADGDDSGDDFVDLKEVDNE